MFIKIITLTSAEIIIKSLGFILIPIYLTLMTKEEFGEFGYIFATISVLPSILTLGLYVPQIKENSISKNFDSVRKVFSSTFLFIIIVSIFLIILLNISNYPNEIFKKIFFITKYAEIKWNLFLFIIFFSILNLLLYSHTLYFNDSIIIIKYNILKFIIINIFGLGFLTYNFSYNDASLDRLIGFAVGEAIFTLTSFFWFAKPFLRFHIDRSYLLDALKIGLSIIPGGIAVLICTVSERFFLGKYYDTNYIAEYNLAILFLMPIQVIMSATQTFLGPHIYEIKENKDAKIASHLFVYWVIQEPILVNEIYSIFYCSFWIVIKKN